MSTLRAAALTVASSLALLVALAPLPASAHDEMIEARPSQGAALSAGDPQVATFRFSDEPLANAAFIAVTDPSGADVSVGEVSVDGDTVMREFDATASGTYTASYRVTSSDGHPIEGSVNFTYNGPAADEPSTDPAQERTADDAANAAASEEDRDYTTVAIIVVATAVLVVGTAVAISTARRRRR